MGWNPANWQITDTLQGQEGGYDLNPLDNGGIVGPGGGITNQFTSTLSNGLTTPLTNVSPTNMTYGAYPQGSSGDITAVDSATDSRSPYQAPDAQTGLTQDQINETNRVNGLRSNFNTKKQGIFDSINQWGDNTAARYGLDVQDFGNKFKQGQDALNRRGADLEAKKMQATSGILGMIGRGVKSAGNYLGGRNAGSSSASGEIAKAYGDIGRRNMSSVGNEYSAGQEQLGVDQNIFNTDAESSLNRFKLNMDEQINGQVESARAALTDLDVQMQNASLPDRIAIDQEKNRIKSELIAKLQGFDQQARQARASAQATNTDQNRATAQTNLAAGQAPADMFSFTDQAPLELQNSGPSASGLPIYTNNKRRLA